MERVFLTTLREMACHPSTDPAIVKALQVELQSMYQDGTISRLYARYLGPGVKWLDIN
jgi:ABC-type amino acid transport substrate-binding protein